MSDKKRITAVVSGRVQGVFFRAETQKAAIKTGVKGYVKNLPDGCVKALFIGTEQQVNDMIQWCRTGSPGARVDNIETTPDTGHEAFETFEIRY